ncbi:hypothetical protein WJX73_001183 [Symbiochloris irregularis]|uniref:Uncharacterized protein n=1 Tax=Symbiochloris irregularis TaxID=706552 RepID=A0AAW1NP50_9CHLO
MERRRTRPTVETAVIKPPIWLLWPARYVLGLFNLAYDQPKPAGESAGGARRLRSMWGPRSLRWREMALIGPADELIGAEIALCEFLYPTTRQSSSGALKVSNLGVMPGTGRYWTVG